MEPKSWRRVAAITSLVLVLVVLPLLSACGGVANTQPAAQGIATAEAEVVAASTCVACHSDEDLLKETAAPIEEEPEEPSGEG
ncbi:MAG: hypothetical protein ISS52_02900 [Dehalococcoidia bacterium]|nr:hypothetical protein [Dehalococcoidia bacterium]